jgi:proteasome alpha subunit
MSVPFYVPPEQLMKDRAEYARKGIARGRAIVAIEYADGIVLVGENPSGALQKISEIYDRIAFAGVGKYNEFESLRIAGIRHADLKGYAYARTDVAAKSLANAYAQTLGHIFTQEVKPYEVEVMVVEVGAEADDNRIFRVTYDGTLFDHREYAAIGGQEEELMAALGEHYRPGASLADAVAGARRAFEQLAERTLEEFEWEAAVLDRTLGRRMFRRLSSAEVAGRETG